VTTLLYIQGNINSPLTLVQFNSEANLYLAGIWCVLMDTANNLKDELKIHKMVHDPLSETKKGTDIRKQVSLLST